ncbi:uncharacterized protein LOC132301585 [Cornus florida]|uniref:uncharacterized protein LOC132301585 n=1 Tax=Cornus florida TaxID=4283 RepID=UPI00289AB609|nr:uncharacterized protein LOC132301585 [Cornus florida]
MQTDNKEYARKCRECQIHDHAIHAPAVELHSTDAPWPFHTWAMDLIGPISPKFRKKKWILVATEIYTKWVKAATLSVAIGQVVANFMKENIICHFGVPQVIVSDNGTPFVNSKLPLALWAYRTTVRGATGSTPFSLVYGIKVILPIEITVLSGNLSGRSKLQFDPRIGELEGLQEQREHARNKIVVYRGRIARAYNAIVRPQVLQKGDLVLRTVVHVMRNLSASKFTPKWERSFDVKATGSSGNYEIGRIGSRKILGTFNAKWLKKYYS